ncbi:MAG: GDP-mannose 4,6-dehydratase [Candidatus Schekmanbacteria bacterium]|nr:GDP-mannose 4,6-dehydratase [Candidatus Schekmanbacteria bacterium]
MSEHFLVTGVAGFIGSQLAEALIAKGGRVTGVDCFTDYYARAIKEANLAVLLRSTSFELLEGDVAELALDPLVQRSRAVFHLAAQAGVRASWGTEFSCYTHHNVLATQHVLEACKQAAALHRLVIASSSSVYGDAERLPVREDHPTRPISPYGVTKLACEHLARLYFQAFGVPVVCLRYFTVYGPRQRPDMAFSKFIRALHEDLPLPVFGDGDQTRDFTFVTDAIAATVSAAERGRPGTVYNIGGGSRVSLRRVIETLAGIAGRVANVERRDRQRGDVRHTYADCALAREELAYSPAVTVEEGLSRQVAWFRSTGR